MGTKKNSQLLMPLILLSVLFSQTWALPALEVEALRNARHADGVSTSDISSLLDDHSPKDYPESLTEKRASTSLSGGQGWLEAGIEMETKKDSLLLLPLILLSVLFSQTWALPALEAEVLSVLFSQTWALPASEAEVLSPEYQPYKMMGFELLVKVECKQLLAITPNA
ncbi:hypothetical protein QTO34_001026 [Cnephaeus nilssonii]|uniref:Uncharacterized protein n=1 Tax=Cnephaeus nilssonii TaxID=3371016 RepID=A0AA40HV27_CNENI|nr:hypothetical protein QTO34_001026 [Eptesicus nilssonii]